MKGLISLLSVAAAAAVGSLVAGCSSDSDGRAATAVPSRSERDGGETTETRSRGTGATSLPPSRPLEGVPQVLRDCNRSRLLRPACPPRLPRGYRYSSTLCRAGERGCWLRNDVLGVESLPAPSSRKRRPSFVHVVLYAGDLGGPKGFQAHADSAFPFDWPPASSARRLVDGLTLYRRTNARALGRYRFGEVEGELVLAPTIHAMDAGHLIFRWSSARIEFAVSLHAWEPLAEAVATLRAIVRSTPGARSA
jgi:hypothetical protein